MAITDKENYLNQVLAKIEAICKESDVCLSSDRCGDMYLSIRDGKALIEIPIPSINGEA